MYTNYRCSKCNQTISIYDIPETRSMCCGHYFPIKGIRFKDIKHSGCNSEDEDIIILTKIIESEYPAEDAILIINLEDEYV